MENKLSSELGVSRIPVREALRSLATEGLVIAAPRRFGGQLSPDVAREMVEVRATLEGLNASWRRSGAILRCWPNWSRCCATAPKLPPPRAAATSCWRSTRASTKCWAPSPPTACCRNDALLRERTAALFAPANLRARQNWDEHAQILQAVIAGDADHGPARAACLQRRQGGRTVRRRYHYARCLSGACAAQVLRKTCLDAISARRWH